MMQWHSCKDQSKDAVLLFRLGDFYEAFYEDAEILARDLGVTLTKRQDIPMAGVPFHAAESYIEKLVKKGHLVAIAEQLENPKNVKGIVKRAITRTVSPATLLSDTYLDAKKSNFFVSISFDKTAFGFARIEVSTGRFEIAEYDNTATLLDELYKSSPAEILIQEKALDQLTPFLNELKTTFAARITTKENWHFDPTLALNNMTKHFAVHSLDGFGLKGFSSGVAAGAVLLHHVEDELSLSLKHVTRISPLSIDSSMVIDRATQKHLELVSSLQTTGALTLFSHMDKTTTPMGARLLRELIIRPLLSIEQIDNRLDGVEALLKKRETLFALLESTKCIKDLERLMSRISTGMCTPRDLYALACSLEHINPIIQLISEFPQAIFARILKQLSHKTPKELIFSTIVREPPLRLSDGYVIKEGVDSSLDEYKQLKKDAQQYLAEYQEKLKNELDIKTLKVGYSKSFGYFIEVSKAQASKMPSTFQRRQTLVNGERFLSPELKEFEEKILSADERISEKELTIFNELKENVSSYLSEIMAISRGVAGLDCLLCFSHLAFEHKYTRPILCEEPGIDIVAGRHPIVESTREKNSFIPNDTTLNHTHQSMMLITGPNMAGKSTYIRQVAIIAIMAHMGCYVPAESAKIGLIDKVFSRIGASDDLARGQSTFMVEMAETANILHNATSRSLVILDEIGRGTSTYDGIAIAWAVGEYLLTAKPLPILTLFATHYSELTALHENFPVAQNYRVAVEESKEAIVFLHKIIRGGTDKSYGIHVASLAGLPKKAITLAKRKLLSLEKAPKEGDHRQALLFPVEDEPLDDKPSEIEEHLREINIDEMSPKDALLLLYTLKNKLHPTS